MIFNKKDKRGISPLVATALLIFIAATAIFLVFSWTKNVSEEAIEKFGEPAEDACNKISFESSVLGERIMIENKGTVPIYALNLEILKSGTRVVRFLKPQDGLIDPAEEDFVTASAQDLSGSIESIAVIPIILGKSVNTGLSRIYPCTSKGRALI